MEYIYELFEYREGGRTFVRVETLSGLLEIQAIHVSYPHFVKVFRGTAPTECIATLKSLTDLEEFQEARARGSLWVDDKKISLTLAGVPPVEKCSAALQAAKPSHHRGFVDEYQWLDVVSRKPQYRDPAVFKGAVLVQADKYLSRLGRKDDEAQELLKTIWYLVYTAKYINNGNKPLTPEQTASIDAVIEAI